MKKHYIIAAFIPVLWLFIFFLILLDPVHAGVIESGDGGGGGGISSYSEVVEKWASGSCSGLLNSDGTCKAIGTNVQAYDANLQAYTETVTAGGTADALTADFTTNITPAAGTRIRVIAAAANATTTPTLAVDGTTARTIVKLGGVALVAGDIKGAGHVLELQYDLANTRWELLNPANPGSGAADNSTASHVICKDSSGNIINCTLDGLDLSGTSTQTIARSAVQTTVGTSRTVAKNAEYVFCTAACAVTPLAPVAGRELCVKNAPGTTGAITLVNITDVYYGKTDNSGWQANANYKLVSGGANTDQICIVGYDATHYLIMNSTGTWTHTAP